MRPTFDPVGGPDVLVDKMLGNAYRNVRLVAIALDEVKHVSANLQSIYDVSQSLSSVVAVAGLSDEILLLVPSLDSVNQVAADLSSVVLVANNILKVSQVAEALPSLTLATERTGTVQPIGTATNLAMGSVSKSKVTSINVTILGTDGNLYFPSATTFSFAVVGTNIVITVPTGGVGVLAGGTAKAHITYLA